MREGYRFEIDGKLTRYQNFYSNADCSDSEASETAEVFGKYKIDSDADQLDKKTSI